MTVRLIGEKDLTTGYGKLNREIINYLKKSEISVQEGLSFNNGKPSSFNIFIKRSTEHIDLPKNSKNILLTMNESKDLADYDINRARSFDEIWVPSEFCLNSYEKYFGNVKKIQFGINRNNYNIFNIKRKTKFSFLSVFSWSFRKGYDVLLHSYFRNFQNNKDVCLTIVSKVLGKHSKDGTKRILDDINEIKKQYNNTPEINLICYELDEKELINLYKNHHCFVLPTRGEGFCFPLLEAGACWLPIITTKYSGHLDFLNNKNSTLLEIDGFSKVGDDKFFLSSYYNTLEFPTLGEKFIENFGEQMKKIYNNYHENRYIGDNEYMDMSENLFVRIKKEFTWEITVNKIKENLKIT